MAHLTDPRSQRAWENFRRRIAELGGEVLETEWLGNKRPYRCLCAKGHECFPWPNSSLMNGGGMCRTCAGVNPVVARDDFHRRIAGLGGVVLEPEWLGVMQPHRCRCVKGHECRPRPNWVQKGGGICPVCARNDPATARENFYRRVTELGGVVLEPEWLGAMQPHRCLCVNGHECQPHPADVQQGHGICRACARNDPAAARESFYKQVAELGGVVLEPEWLGALKPHRCRCVKGHECQPRPNALQQGQGLCRSCFDWDQDVVYLVRNPAAGWVKFGITRRDGRPRLSLHRARGFTKILYLETGLTPGLAVYVEQKIKTSLKMTGAKPVQGYEYFDDEHIALILNEIGIWIA